jgi:hypothetical protein
MDIEELNTWFPVEQQQQLVARLVMRVGLTRVRAECFVRLWIYVLLKQSRSQLKPPLSALTFPQGAVVCTLREAAALFYGDRDQGSDRAAGMMLDKLAALGLITKFFDGNTTQIEIQPVLELLSPAGSDTAIAVNVDQFDPRCDAIPIANLLATNYNWMNRNTEAVPHRITGLLRSWANHYNQGMRVLRRCDNLNPVGIYVLYPTASQSDVKFFSSPTKGLHLSAVNEVDPFQMAVPGDPTCVSVFIRSWMIDPAYPNPAYVITFLQDAQQTLRHMQQDFPNLCDLYLLVIHPQYEALPSALGFQKTSREASPSVYWMYLALDRYLALDIPTLLKSR